MLSVFEAIAIAKNKFEKDLNPGHAVVNAVHSELLLTPQQF